MLLWGWLGLLLAPPALAQSPWDALDPITRGIYQEGLRLEASGDPERAAVRYGKVLERDPGWTQALLDLGRVQERLGRVVSAEQTYGRAPYDADAVEALARLMLRTERPERAARLFRQLRDLRPDTVEFLVPEARAVSATEPLEGAEILLEYLERPGAEPQDSEVVEVFAEVAKALRSAGHAIEASALLDRLVDAIVERVGEVERIGALDAVEALRERFSVEEEARLLMAAAGQPLIPQQQAELVAARAAFADGRLDEAERALRLILLANDRSAETWAAMSDVLEARGDIAGAERAVRMAEELAPTVPAYPARLGDLLAAHYGGRYDAEAAEAYGRALQRHGGSAELWFRRGRLQQRAGQPERAVASFRRYLAQEPSGPHAERARRFVEGWERVRPDPPDVPRAPGRPASVPQEAWFAHHVAEVRYRRADGDPDGLRGALEDLAAARQLAPGFVRSVNLEATILRALGDDEAARALYEHSLGLDADQPEVLVVLAAMDRDGGDPRSADERLERAARLGSSDALLHLARRDVAAWRLLSARAHLDAYFASATSGVSHEAAVALRSEVDQRLRGLVALGLGASGALVLLPIGLRWRRRSGSSLEALLRASPAAWREVARVASAIRHEVLKHNTTALSTVADALEVRDPEPARWAADKLFGPRGALERFREYVDELRVLGRVHGVRLNLRYRDPVLGPLIEAMDRLAALEPDLRSGGGRRLAAELRDLSRILNRTGYRGLGVLIRRVCLLQLDAPLLREIWDEVRREPALRDGPPIELELILPPERLWLRIFRGDLQDILVNLLRNAVEASREVGADRLAVAVALDEDDITGLERVAIRVADHAPRRISTAMIRGRYIGRGLGLAVDLVSRNGGSVHVEDEAGFSKAVVVRLPRAEHPNDDDEEG